MPKRAKHSPVLLQLLDEAALDTLPLADPVLAGTERMKQPLLPFFGF